MLILERRMPEEWRKRTVLHEMGWMCKRRKKKNQQNCRSNTTKLLTMMMTCAKWKKHRQAAETMEETKKKIQSSNDIFFFSTFGMLNSVPVVHEYIWLLPMISHVCSPDIRHRCVEGDVDDMKSVNTLICAVSLIYGIQIGVWPQKNSKARWNSNKCWMSIDWSRGKHFVIFTTFDLIGIEITWFHNRQPTRETFYTLCPCDTENTEFIFDRSTRSNYKLFGWFFANIWLS